MANGTVVCVLHTARQTDADVECYVAKGGSEAVGGLPEGTHSDQRRSTASSRQPQHTADH